MPNEMGNSDFSDRGVKLGLALSGGGFRASFFHIGVLARLADCGLLRHLEVISTVSGGSIIGALYYLHLKNLLESKVDEEIRDQHYQQIVQAIEAEFLRGVQRNIIMRIYVNPLKSLGMSRARYSQSVRLGKLYDEIFYRPVLNPAQDRPVRMRDLIIKPAGARADFYPLRDNGGRAAKVPVLLINATSINTGRNWRFEASSMGEHIRDHAIAWEIDKNHRWLAPQSFTDLTSRYQDFELGQAVSASACLPGLFNPLPLDGLYPDSTRLQLVDGGVHDNQGIQGLFDLGCTHFIVSDATKQSEIEARPTTRIQPMMRRIRELLVDRVREEQLYRLLERPDPPAAFIHPRKGLSVSFQPYIGRDEQPIASRDQHQPQPVSPYGIAPKAQFLVSRIRTHLDSFTEIEAYAIMMAGYRISEVELTRTPAIRRLLQPALAPMAWHFREIDPWLQNPTPGFLRHLRVGGERFLKAFRLNGRIAAVTFAAFVLGVLVIVPVLQMLYQNIMGWPAIDETLSITITLRQLMRFIYLLAAGFLLYQLSKVIPLLGGLHEAITNFWSQALLPALVSPIIILHVFIFDPIFQKMGRLARLGTPPPTKAPPSLSVENRLHDPSESTFSHS
jgi:NTE family protein